MVTVLPAGRPRLSSIFTRYLPGFTSLKTWLLSRVGSDCSIISPFMGSLVIRKYVNVGSPAFTTTVISAEVLLYFTLISYRMAVCENRKTDIVMVNRRRNNSFFMVPG